MFYHNPAALILVNCILVLSGFPFAYTYILTSLLYSLGLVLLLAGILFAYIFLLVITSFVFESAFVKVTRLQAVLIRATYASALVSLVLGFHLDTLGIAEGPNISLLSVLPKVDQLDLWVGTIVINYLLLLVVFTVKMLSTSNKTPNKNSIL